jgi:hypothetical protein
MALGGTIRRSAMALIVIGAGGFAAMNPGAVKAFYENIYPSDPAKHEALELCFMQDHKFNRLDAGERDNCATGACCSRLANCPHLKCRQTSRMPILSTCNAPPVRVTCRETTSVV